MRTTTSGKRSETRKQTHSIGSDDKVYLMVCRPWSVVFTDTSCSRRVSDHGAPLPGFNAAMTALRNGGAAEEWLLPLCLWQNVAYIHR